MIAGVILAGGRSSRMGGQDKARANLGGDHLLGRAIANLRPQVGPLAISSNESLGDAAGGLSVLPDMVTGYQGPLAGIHTGLCWAAPLDGIEALATVSVDAPFIPGDFVARLTRRARESDAAIVLASSAGRRHSTCALWRVSLVADLEAFLRKGSSRRVMDFVSRIGFEVEEFEFGPGPDPFFNVNTPDDLEAARRWLGDAS